MKAIARAATVFFAALMLANCGGKPSHEDVANDFLDTMEEFADTITGVTDEKSADKAVGDLDKLADKIEKLKAQMEELGEPPADVQAALKPKMEARKKEFMSKMMGMAGTMMTKPELMEKLKPAMDRLGDIMKE